MDKRTFESADGKFWEIWLDGGSVYTRFGKIGTKGQTRLKTGDENDAEAQIADKLKQGFVEANGKPNGKPAAKPTAASGLDDKELGRLLKGIKTLDDPGVLVLADWLQAQNHPWGELIVLQHTAATDAKKAAALTKTADKLIETRGADILGPLAKLPHTTFSWSNGFIKRASIGTNADAKAIAKAIKLLLAQPIARVVETIAINTYVETFPFWNDWSASTSHVVDPWADLDAIAKLIPPRVTRVGFGGWPAPAAAGYVWMPSFAKLSKAFPALTGLELTGTCAEKPGVLALPQLVDLEVRFAEADGAAIEAIVKSKLPKLERLSVWLGANSNVLVDDVYPPDEWDEDNEDASRYPATFSAADLDAMSSYDVNSDADADDLRGLLAMKLPALVHLGFPSSMLTAEMIGAIVKSPLVKQLKTLDLSHSKIDDKAVAALVAAKKQLAHLDTIDVSNCDLGDKGAAKLEALPNAHVGKQPKPAKGFGGRIASDAKPAFRFRYVAAME
jgi:predicted DNA-binding WGR domain protein